MNACGRWCSELRVKTKGEKPVMTDEDTVLVQARLITGSTMPPHTLLLHTYEVERLLARGGMGEVYLARHTELGTKHAIKVIKPDLLVATEPTFDVLELFRREATILRDIHNDAVVSYEGFFRDEKKNAYLVMEYVDGPSLAQVLKQRVLSIDEVYLLRDRLIGGLAAVHEKGVVHRDISPDNVILPEGQVTNAKLIDFGIAKLGDPTVKTIIGDTFVGKLRYMAPEQLGLFGSRVAPCSDIYSLGLVLAAAATGKLPDMGTSYATALQSRQVVPDLSEVPADLRRQLTAMLQPNPAARPQHVTEIVTQPQPVIEAVTQIIEAVTPSPKDSAAPFSLTDTHSRPASRREQTPVEPKGPATRRTARWLIVLGGALAVALVAIFLRNHFLSDQESERRPPSVTVVPPGSPVSTVTREPDSPGVPPESPITQPTVTHQADSPEVPPESPIIQPTVTHQADSPELPPESPITQPTAVTPPASSKPHESQGPKSPAPVTPKPAKPKPAQAQANAPSRNNAAKPARCGDVLLRAQLGESLSEKDRTFLQKECK